MKTKNTTLYFYILFLIPLFPQVIAQNKGTTIKDRNNTYLDSIKKTFVKNNMVARVDSLWMNELTSLNTYNTLSADIENGAPD